MILDKLSILVPVAIGYDDDIFYIFAKSDDIFTNKPTFDNAPKDFDFSPNQFLAQNLRTFGKCLISLSISTASNWIENSLSLGLGFNQNPPFSSPPG